VCDGWSSEVGRLPARAGFGTGHQRQGEQQRNSQRPDWGVGPRHDCNPRTPYDRSQRPLATGVNGQHASRGWATNRAVCQRGLALRGGIGHRAMAPVCHHRR
jgi:hypothetical protein